MTTFMAHCIRLEWGAWRVFCLRCNNEIGTMVSDVLMRAVVALSSRGGMLCPTCRAQSCTLCGDLCLEPDPRPLCTLCAVDVEDYVEADGMRPGMGSARVREWVAREKALKSAPVILSSWSYLHKNGKSGEKNAN